MRAYTFDFKSEDNLNIHVYQWIPEENIEIKGVVQMAHGMAETASRYERFAEFLTANGYIVYINDHRGHGKTAGEVDKIGYLGEANGFQKLIEDMNELTKIIKKAHRDLPLFLFSHSMGSFAAQEYIMHYGEKIDGVILSGTNGPQGMILEVGKWVAKTEIKKNGRKAKSKKLDKLIFGKHNNKFKPNRTPFDWLSRDEKEVDKYIADPLCGTIFTAGFFYDFIEELIYIEEKENLLKIPKNLPIFIFSGDADPVGNFGKGVLKLVEAYKSRGIRYLEYKIYPGGRHEMLNETNRDEVMHDVLEWLNKWQKEAIKSNTYK